MSHDWELIARTEPMWGVLSTDRFLAKNLTPETRQEFFDSGVAHAKKMLERAEALLGPIAKGTAIDFGCGVGRMTIPLSRSFREVIGIDASPSMLRLTEENCARQGVSNARTIASADVSSLPPQSVDFINSLIVFQHIPEPEGQAIFRSLLSTLRVGGAASVHFVIANLSTQDYRERYVHKVPLADGGTAEMQMNVYDFNALAGLLHRAGVMSFCADFEQHGGHLGCILYFRRAG